MMHVQAESRVDGATQTQAAAPADRSSPPLGHGATMPARIAAASSTAAQSRTAETNGAGGHHSVTSDPAVGPASALTDTDVWERLLQILLVLPLEWSSRLSVEGLSTCAGVVALRGSGRPAITRWTKRNSESVKEINALLLRLPGFPPVSLDGFAARQGLHRALPLRQQQLRPIRRGERR